jgi:hypothetical protein
MAAINCGERLLGFSHYSSKELSLRNLTLENSTAYGFNLFLQNKSSSQQAHTVKI